MSATLQESTTQAILGIDINYVTCGPDQGQPLLLLHGHTRRWQTFSTLIPALAKHYHVYALDFRGHGKSGHTPGHYRLLDLLSDVISFIKNVIQQPTAIFGSSLGGMVAIMTAAHYPDWVKTIIVGDAPLSINSLKQRIDSQRDITHQCAQWLRQGQLDKIRDEIKDPDTIACLMQCDPDMLTAITDQFQTIVKGYEIQSLLPTIHCPVLIIRGNATLGGLIPDEDMKEAQHLLPHLKEVSLPHIGHRLLHEDPTAVLKAVESFLSKI